MLLLNKLKLRNLAKANLMKAILMFIFVFVLFSNAWATKDKNVNLSTQEYSNYRRFILTIPENIEIEENSIIMPQIDSNPSLGEFSIIIKSENVRKFEGERLRKDEGEIPIRFVLSYPDKNTLQITGKTVKYKNINAFYIIGKQQYIFDILTDDQNQSGFYTQSVKLLENNPISNDNPEDQPKKTLNIIQNNKPDKSQSNIISQSLKTALMIFVAITFLVIATISILKIFNGEKIFGSSAKTVSAKKVKAEKIILEKQIDFPIIPKKVRKKINYYNDSSINSLVYDKKERKIRILMNKKQLNYDEAEMLLNLSKSNFHA